MGRSCMLLALAACGRIGFDPRPDAGSGAPRCAMPGFQAVPWLYLGDTVEDVAVADLDGDGNVDLAVVEKAIGVAVLRGHGDGTFGAPTMYADANAGSTIALGDVDGDGMLDVVIGEIGASVAVFPGHGDATLGAATSYPSAQPATSLAVADLTTDGKADVVYASTNSTPGVGVLRSTGAALTAVMFYPWAGGTYPTSIAIADLTGDGLSDLIVPAQIGSAVKVLAGNGDGTFTAKPDIALTAMYPSTAAVADLNHDGKLDVVAAANTDIYVHVALGHGDGTFDAETTFMTNSPSVGQVAIADLDRDGSPDVLADTPFDTTMFLRGGGDGSLQAPAIVAGGGGNDGPLHLVDLNHDGVLDLVTVNLFTHAVAVVLGAGDGSFRGRTAFPAAGGQGLIAADVNGDSRADVLQVLPSGGVVDVFVTTNTFVPFASQPHAGTMPNRVAVGKLDGDDIVDLVVADLGGGQLLMLHGAGDGTFGAAVPIASVVAPWGVAVGDLDGDGAADIVATASPGGAADVLVIVRGHASAMFDPPLMIPLAHGLHAVALADVDGDGHLDVLAAATGDGAIYVLLGRGDFTFGTVVPVPAAVGLPGLVVADFDRDGHVDLVTGTPGDATIEVLYGNGDGTFAAPVAIATPPSVVAVVAADFDGDGAPDIAAASRAGTTILYARGRSFAPPGVYGTVTDALELATGDLDGDGRPDLVSNSTTTLGVLFNSCR